MAGGCPHQEPLGYGSEDSEANTASIVKQRLRDYETGCLSISGFNWLKSMCRAWDHHAALVIGAIPTTDSLETLGSCSSCMAVERQNYLQRIEAVCNRCLFSQVCFRLDFYLNRLKQGWFFAGIKYFLPCQVAKIGIKWPKMALNGLKWHKMAKKGIKWPKI